MFSPLARGKASWDGDLQCETYSDQTVRHELLFFFCSLRFCVYCDSYFTANAWIHERQKIAMSTKRESWKYLNFNLEKNIDRPIKRRNNAEVKGYFWSSLSLRFVIVKKYQAYCLICQTLQDGCLEFLLSSCFVLVAAFSLLTYAFCSLVAEFHFLRVQGKQNIIVILEVPQI